MRNILLDFKMVMVLAVSLVLLGSCQDDDYYERPEWLEPPVYDLLSEKGNFNHYLSCVDKSGYAKNLKESGYYTVFAPTDEAFEAFFQEKGFNSVDDIPEDLVNDIVSYSLTSVGSTRDEIDYYQRELPQEERFENENIAFKRSTFNYKGVYEETDIEGVTRDIIDVNVVAEFPGMGGYLVENDYNNKPIPFFTQGFLEENDLSADDYNYFFPETEFSGFNVAGSKVVEEDLISENGVVHTVDRVIVPLPNLEEILDQTEETSDFMDILKKYMVDFYPASRSFRLRQEQATGEYKEIFVKGYPGLHFAPNCENYLEYGGGEENDKQIDGWTLFAPSNQALNTYLENEFLGKGYNSLDEVPPFVLTEFINAHFFRTTVWPSKFDEAQNYYGEPARFDANSEVVKKKMGSNGLFYAVSDVQRANAFSTVLGDVLLNPDYTTMYQGLLNTENNGILRNPILDLDLFLMSNQMFEELGLSYNVGLGQWEHNNPDWGDMTAFTILDRLIQMHIMRDQDVDFTEDGFGLLETNMGEYIRYISISGTVLVWGPGQSLSSAGTLLADEEGNFVNETENGRTLRLNKPLKFSTKSIGNYLETNQNYRAFFRYLEKSAASVLEGDVSPVYDPETKQIAGIESSTDQTYIIPDDDAIAQAVEDGVLPEITQANFSQTEQEMVLAFVRYHILNDKIIATNRDYDTEETFTHFRDEEGETRVFVFSNRPDQVEFIDRNGRYAVATATMNSNHTNVLANRAVIHLVDNYLDHGIRFDTSEDEPETEGGE